MRLKIITLKRTNMKNMYLVQYSEGSYDTYYVTYLFVTADEQVAKTYVDKFNKLLEKWQDYFESTDDEGNYININDMRYYDIMNINKCSYGKIEVR